jgi:penicillin-binding protein 2
MYYLQIAQSKHYKHLAEGNRIKIVFLTPLRGHILDRFGKPIATNRQTYQLTITPEECKNINTTLNKLKKLAHLSDYQISRAKKWINKMPKFIPIAIREDLNWDEVSLIEINAPYLPGVTTVAGKTRYYHSGEAFSHLIGYVQAVSDTDKVDKSLLKLHNFKIGKTGVEKMFDKHLQGKVGVKEVEVNAQRRELRDLEIHPSIPGADLAVSIDYDLQILAHKRLSQEHSASAVVMDVKTGELLAMVSHPNFDSNLFPNGIDEKHWQELKNNPYGILMNKPISGQYAPGSIFKVIVGLAGLEAGILTPHKAFSCSGVINLGSHRFHCWKRHGHGRLTLVDAIRESCDVFFYETAKRIGIDKIAKIARMFGLGKITSLHFPNEKPGLIPSTQWKKDTFGQPWHPGETLIAGIGQGFMLATPLQLAVMTARLASGGREVNPTLKHHKSNTPIIEFPRLNVSEKNVDLILKGMDQVVNAPGGTAWRARINIKGKEVAGKTSTTQVRRITMQERRQGIIKNQDLPWRYRDHGVFIALAPVGNPRYAVSVVVEHGGVGGRVAASISHDILLAVQDRK